MAAALRAHDFRFTSAIATRGEVAQLLHVSRPEKLTDWATPKPGRAPLVHTIKGQGRFTVPLVGIAEAATLNALRVGGMSMQEARRAADFIRREYDDEFALASPRLVTDGTDAFIQDHVGVVRIRDGQSALQEVIAAHLRPLIIGTDGKVEAFHVEEFAGAKVTIDPRFNAGRMSFVRNRVPVFVVAGALAAGDSVDEVAIDYALTRDEVAEVARLSHWLAKVT